MHLWSQWITLMAISECSILFSKFLSQIFVHPWSSSLLSHDVVTKSRTAKGKERPILDSSLQGHTAGAYLVPVVYNNMYGVILHDIFHLLDENRVHIVLVLQHLTAEKNITSIGINWVIHSIDFINNTYYIYSEVENLQINGLFGWR